MQLYKKVIIIKHSIDSDYRCPEEMNKMQRNLFQIADIKSLDELLLNLE